MKIMASQIQDYEEVRRRKLEENKKKLDKLKLSHLALSLQEATAPKTPPVKRKAPREEFIVAKRRSSRIADLPEQVYRENKMGKAIAKEDTSNKADSKPKKEAKKAEAAKDPNMPKRPLSAFFVFLEDFRKIFKEKNPDNKLVSAVGKAAGDKWKSMNASEKAPYEAMAAIRRAEYTKSMAAYNKKLFDGASKISAPVKEEEETKSDKSKFDASEKIPYEAMAAKRRAEYTKSMAAYNKKLFDGASKRSAPVKKEEEAEADKSKSDIEDDNDESRENRMGKAKAMADTSNKADSKLSVKRKAAEKPKKEAKKAEAAKDLTMPTRPSSAFFVFMEDFRKIFKEKNPDNKLVSAVGKAAGDKWKSMNASEKAPYEAMAAIRRAEYTKSMAAYNKKKLFDGVSKILAPVKKEEEVESDKS